MDLRVWHFCQTRLTSSGVVISQVLGRNVLLLLDTLQLERVVVVGYDVGGRVAFTLARTVPQRVQALVLGATLYPGVGNAYIAARSTTKVLISELPCTCTS